MYNQEWSIIIIITYDYKWLIRFKSIKTEVVGGRIDQFMIRRPTLEGQWERDFWVSEGRKGIIHSVQVKKYI